MNTRGLFVVVELQLMSGRYREKRGECGRVQSTSLKLVSDYEMGVNEFLMQRFIYQKMKQPVA